MPEALTSRSDQQRFARPFHNLRRNGIYERMTTPSAPPRQIGRWVQGEVCFSAFVRTIDGSNRVQGAYQIEKPGETPVEIEVLAPRFENEVDALEHIKRHLSTFHGMSRAPL